MRPSALTRALGVRFSRTMHSQNMAILKGLVSVAWADGRIAGEETEVLEALLQAFEASPSEAHEIRMYAREPRTLVDVPLNDLSTDARRIMLQHAVLLSFVDGHQDEKEKKLIDDLCEVLRIPSVESRGIIAAAEERARTLLKLL
jgi:uncharacterized tellurite resistance protein B-like protein